MNDCLSPFPFQAKQVAAANKSAEDAKTVKGFKPIGERVGMALCLG